MSSAPLAIERLSVDPQRLEPYLGQLRMLLGDRAIGLVAYGSCLNDATQSATSTPDFYVVVDRYGSFHPSLLHRALNWMLPPNIYHFTVGEKVAKYSVIRLKDLKREVSGRAKDVYHLGRFSKRIAIVDAATDQTRHDLLEVLRSAAFSVAQKVVALLPQCFSLDELAKGCLRFSYVGDVRVEAEDKVDRLWQAGCDHYRSLFGQSLEKGIESGWALKRVETENTPTFQQTGSSFSRFWRRQAVRWFLSRSRMRAQLRWPKGIFTVENWIDYLIAKIERTQGIRLEMTPRQKRFWFVYGWKYFLLLRRKNLIK